MPSWNRGRTMCLSAAMAAALAFGAHAGVANTKPLTGGVTKTDLGFEVEHYGLTVKASSSPKFKAVVDGVRPGSPAFYAGLKNGDKIISADASNKDKVVVTFDRAGTTYGVTLRGTAPRYDAGTTRGTSDANVAPVLTPQQKAQLIANHELVVLLDQTQSMSEPDCPGHLSRWDWCRAQTTSFLKEMSGYLKDITVVTFNTSFHEFKHVDASQIAAIYSSYRPAGGTNMAAPLANIFNDYLRRRAMNGATKPLLVAVISDGMPNQPGGPEAAKLAVEQAIVDATNRIQSPDELTVTFLQVGQAFEGGDFLTMLDEHTPGKFDVVDTKTFSQLQQLGLKEALVDALIERAIHASDGNGLKEQVRELTKQSRRLHEELRK